MEAVESLSAVSSGGLSQDFAGLGQNRLTAKKTKFELGHKAARNIPVVNSN